LILEKIPFPSCYRLPTMLGAGAWKLWFFFSFFSKFSQFM
jgi:hypothetical protein